MKKKLLFLICTVILAIVCSAGMLIYAENEGEGSDLPVPEEAEYTVVFVHEEKEYPMTKSGDEYIYESDILCAKTLYRIEIKDKNGDKIASALLYKNGEGTVDVSYNENKPIDSEKLTIEAGSKSVYDTEFDFDVNPYYVSVKGGIIKNGVSGAFAGCELSSFYFAENDEITVKAPHDQDQCVAEWKNNIDKDLGTDSKVDFKIKGNNKNIELEAKIDYLPIDKLFDLGTTVDLKKDYEITSPIKLTEEKSYTLNLNGFSIKGTSNKGVFEIDGAELTIEGNGKIESTNDTCGAINLKSGALTLNEQTVIGSYSAISAIGGTLTVNGGSYKGGSYGAIHFSDNSETVAVIFDGVFNEDLGSDAAFCVQGGDITIRGGSFYGTEAIKTYGLTCNIKIYLGIFFSDNFESDTHEYIDEGSTFEGDSIQGYTVSFKEKKYNITINDGVLSNGYSIWEYEAGASVTVRPKQNADGMTFECWEILDGDITIEDLTVKQITFIMPEGDVVIRACFKAESVDTGAIGTGTVPPTNDTGITTDTNGNPVGTTKAPVGAVTTNKKDNAAAGSMAIIILIIILIALLIAAIAVSIILIVRNYRAERDAAEREELGKSVVDNLADRLSSLDFGDAAGASAGAFIGTLDDDEKEDVSQVPKSEGIDFDREIDLGLTNTMAGIDAVTEAEPTAPKADGDIKLRRPKKPVQRPGRTTNTTKDE